VKIKIGTRGSALARTQSADILKRMESLGHECETVVIRTAGDKDQVRPFGEIGAPGLFVREIEAALLDGRIDLAVHSYKDLPTEGPDALTVAAIPERVDPADCLLIRQEAFEKPSGAAVLADGMLPLRPAALVGTASSRRQVLLQEMRPDLRIESLRGNVPTRLDRLRKGDFDAVLLATAGLSRLEKESRFLPAGPLDFRGIERVRLDPALFVPAPAQGALALQTRRDDEDLVQAVRAVHDAKAAIPLSAERHLQALVEGGCQLPFGAWCRTLEGGDIELLAVMERAGRVRRSRTRGTDPLRTAAAAWEELQQDR